MPRAVKIVLLLMAVLAVTHVLVPVYMATHSGALALQISHDHPELSASQIANSVGLALRSAIIFHAVLMIALIALAFAFSRRRRWSRKVITTLSVISLISSLVSWRSSPMFHGAIVATNVLLVVLVAILWMHPDVDRFLRTDPS